MSSDDGAARLLDLHRTLSRYLSLDDFDLVLFVLAVAVGVEDGASPVWGMIVGPSSSGKSEILRVVEDVADEHATDLTPAGLLSGYVDKKAEHPDDRFVETGLLSRLGEEPALVIASDFSSLLEAGNYERKKQLYAFLRHIFDGELQRDLGGLPEPLEWSGKVSMLAACTSSIDGYTSLNALGPRWVYLRLPDRETDARLNMAHRALQLNQAEHRDKARTLAGRLVRWGRERVSKVVLPDVLREELVLVANAATIARATIPRDFRGEIDGLPDVEEPARFAQQLATIARSAVALGASDDTMLGLARRIGRDSMTQIRARVLSHLHDGQRLSEPELARRIGCDRKTAGRTCEELDVLGVLRRHGTSGGRRSGRFQASRRWSFTGDTAAEVRPLFEHTAGLEHDEQEGA